MKKLSLSQLPALFAAIAEKETLYLPVDAEGGARFERFTEGKTLTGELNTVRSAKDFFFPQTENLAEFKMEGKNIEVIDPRTETGTLLFSVSAPVMQEAFRSLTRCFW